MAKAIIFGLISLVAFIAAAFSSRTSKRKFVIITWWIAFAIGFFFHVMALIQDWNDSKRIEQLEYQDVAYYSALGNKSASVIGVPMVRTPINNWSKEFMTRDDGHGLEYLPTNKGLVPSRGTSARN